MAILTVGIFTACSDQLPLEEDMLFPAEETGTIIFAPSITVPEGDGNHVMTSRGAYYDGTKQGVYFDWTENDVVGIFPLTNKEAQQLKYNCTTVTTTAESAQDGISKAQFAPDNAEFAWTSGNSYRVYYPFTSVATNITAIPLDYTGQVQVGKPDMTDYYKPGGDKEVYLATEKSSSEHLSAKSFLLSDAATPNNGNLSFRMHHLGGAVRFFLSMPKTINANITEIRLVASKAIFHAHANLNVLTGETSPTGDATNYLCLNLEDGSDHSKGVNVKYDATTDNYGHYFVAYMMAYPIKLTELLTTDDGLYIYAKGKDSENKDVYFRSVNLTKRDIPQGVVTQFKVVQYEAPIDLQPITVQEWQDGLTIDNGEDGKGTENW